jgi:hypothetical protein
MGLPKGAFFGTVPYFPLRGARVKVCALSALCALRSVRGPSWPLSAVSLGIATSASHATECVFSVKPSRGGPKSPPFLAQMGGGGVMRLKNERHMSDKSVKGSIWGTTRCR